MTEKNRPDNQSQRTLTLYSTSACHLCETALALITPFLESQSIRLEEVDISESDQLMELYGIRIPVLKFNDEGSSDDLGWPFSESDFLAFARRKP